MVGGGLLNCCATGLIDPRMLALIYGKSLAPFPVGFWPHWR